MALRVGIIGCGVIHGTHINAVQSLSGELELSAVCDEIPGAAQKTGDENGVPYFTDIAEMLASAPMDIVAVCTPSGLHAKHGIMAANAGKHVISEKPIEVSLQAADALIAACRENNVVLEVVSQHRYTPGMQYLKAALDAGRLGDLCYAESFTKWYRTQEYYDSGGWRGTWELDGGGALMNQGVHFVDQLRWIMGPVKSVAATMATRAHERIEVEDVVSATIQFESGAVGTLTASTALYPGYRQSLEVYGTMGTITVDSNKVLHAQFADATVERTASAGGLKNVPPPEYKNGEAQGIPAQTGTATDGGGTASDPRAVSVGGHVAHYKDLLESIATGRTPFMNGQEARNALELILAVYQSAKNGGERVTLPLAH